MDEASAGSGDVKLWTLSLLMSLPALLALAVGVLDYLPFFEDDAYISLRYAEHLASGRGLTFNDGERVEGFTNFLWVALVAGLSKLMPFESAARVLGVACTTNSFVLLARWGLLRGLSRAAIGASLMMLAVSGSVVIWAIGGLEAALVGMLLVWAMVELDSLGLDDSTSTHLRRSLPLGLLVLSRADGIGLALLVVMAGVLCQRKARRRWQLALLPLGVFVAYEVFRLTYFRDWLPNTAYVRRNLGTHHLVRGLHYVASFAKWHPALLGLCSWWIWLALRGNGEERGFALAVLIVAVPYTAYVVIIGGGLFPGYRHLLPLVMMLGFISQLAFQRLFALSFGGYTIAACLALLFAHGALSHIAPRNVMAKHGWQQDGVIFGAAIRSVFSEREPLIAVEAAGAIPFFSKFRTLDTYGLNNRHIAHSAPLVDGAVGHEHGDADYVWAQKPDLLVFRSGRGGKPWSTWGLQLLGRANFADMYFPQCFRVETHTRVLTNLSYVRRDGALGAHQEGNTWHVPAWQLEGARACVVLDQNVASISMGEGDELRFRRTSEQMDFSWKVEGGPKISIEEEGADLILRASDAVTITRLIGYPGRGSLLPHAPD